MATIPNQPFSVLENSLKNLFKSYDQLEESLKSLSGDVFKIRVDAESPAVDITVFGETTRMNLVSYLTCLKEMSTAMVNEDLKTCNFQASLAKTFMNKSLNLDMKEGNAEKMLESVVELLRRCENKQQVSNANIEKVIEDAVIHNSIIKSFILRLLQEIKEEISKAVDDSKLLANSSDVERELGEVKQAITAVKCSYEENLSALDNIISTVELLAKEKNEDELRPLKANAEIVLQICNEKLLSVIRK